MATILEFPFPRLRVAHESAIGIPAEVVIFPGVRIERSEFKLSDRVGRKSDVKNRKSEARKSDSPGSDV